MTRFKHTPGPWMIRCQDYPVPGSYKIGASNSDEFTAISIGEANARLIAAAPEMCIILQSIKSDLARTDNNIWDSQIEQIEALLNKINQQ